MNEIGDDSESDNEFDFTAADSKAPSKATTKRSLEQHDYHQSKNHTHSESEHSRHDAKRSGDGTRGHSPPPPSSKHSKAHSTAMAKDQHELDIDNFGAKSAKSVNTAAANQHSDYVANKNWLMRACHPHDPTTQCYMIREKTLVGGGLTLRLYIEPKNDTGKFYYAKIFVNVEV